MNTCGREDCASSCHRPEVTPGRYCAPARCYCGGCPGHVPLPPRAEPMVAQLVECPSCTELVVELGAAGVCGDCRALRLQELTTAPPPPDPAELRTAAEAPAELQAIRAQLGQLAEEHLGPARHRANRERAARSS